MGELADEDYDRFIDSGLEHYRNGRDPSCRHCGLWLRWHETPQGWRTVNPDNTIHMCQAVASADEFDVVRPASDEFGNPL